VFGGSGTNRTVKVTPASNAIGRTLVTVTVSDGTNKVSRAFLVTVNPPLLDDSYVASTQFAFNRNTGIISGNVTSLPVDPKSVYWAKTKLSVVAGQVLNLGGKMYYSGSGPVPVSVYLVDLTATNHWISPERVIYIDSSYGYYQTDLIIMAGSTNASLFISCGLSKGSYEFQQLAITAMTAPAPAPVTDLYLRQLLPVQTAGLYSAEWYWNPVSGSAGYEVRTALTRAAIEKGAAGNLLSQQLLPASQNTYRCDINTNLYGGVYVAVTSVVGAQESKPWITWYLPGQIFSTADDVMPPLCLTAKVTTNDVNFVYNGYTNNTPVPALTPGQPAGREQRADFNNTHIVGRPSGYSFDRSQYLKGQRMQ
jgi:hypothetical protein